MEIDADALAVAPLDTAAARDPGLAGAKAANLARAAAAGMPVLPGFVIVPAGRTPGLPRGADALRTAWRALGGAEGRPLVVRSSSAHEDTADSSMAGRFESVLDVRGWDAFTAAVRRVQESAARVAELVPAGGTEPPGAPSRPGATSRPGTTPLPGATSRPDTTSRPGTAPLSGTASPTAQDSAMSVLVQPMLAAAAGGVMFGADPVEGRFDRILVSAVSGGPDRLVDGSTQGVRYQLSRHGRLLHTEPGLPRAQRPLTRRMLAQLVRLARRAEAVHGGPQDVEFGFDADGTLWLFQARPITAMAARPARRARLLGPGPVAETLPDVLQPLEEDLWLAPMNQGLILALDIAGAAPRRQLRRSPLVSSVGGRAAADLVRLGAAAPAHPFLHFINPAPGARRAAAAWRVGRLRAALPLLARDLMADVDRQLNDLAAPRQLLGGELVSAVAWGRTVLASLHAQESLAGVLLTDDTGNTAAGEALAVLGEGRSAGLADDELISRHPVLLALLPPSLGERGPLPEQVGWHGLPRGVGFLSIREGLRLRIRWVQEMQTAMVREAGARMDAHCHAGERSKIALLRWRELSGVADGGTRPADLAARTPRPETPPLPAAFRLADGRPVAVAAAGRGRHGTAGQGAGGGQGAGTAWHGDGDRPAGAVLVVRSLAPSLAPLLPGLSGMVAETGSVLSHLAVLAREHGVPTAVGVPDALLRFPPGTPLRVDGGTGAVEELAAPAAAAGPAAAPVAVAAAGGEAAA